jgi:hypothetical protein
MSIAINRTDTAFNTANTVLGGILLVSPWLLGFRGENWVTWNAWLSGGVVIVLSLLAVARPHDWEEWLNVCAGLWIIGSPWLLFFDDVTSALSIYSIVGLCIVVIATIELYRLYMAPTT